MRYFFPFVFAASLIAQTSQAPNQPSVKPEVKPEDKCAVEGTVVNATSGEPLKKVHLSLSPVGDQSGVPYGTVTEDGGHFLFDNVDPGRYTLRGLRNGFVSQSYSSQGNTRRTTTLTLANGQKMKELTFKLTPQGVITGHVVDQDGEPISNVRLQCMSYRYQRGKKQLVGTHGATTNDLGEFRIYGLAPGKFLLSATKESQDVYMPVKEHAVGSAKAVQAMEQGYPTIYYPNAPNPESASQIEITPGAVVHGIDITLLSTRTLRVKGHVNLGAAGSQRNNISLEMRPRSPSFYYMPVATARIDADGNFEMRGVPPGSYAVTGYLTNDGKTYSARVSVDVGTTNLDGVEVSFIPPREINGHLAVEESGDLGSATVYVSLMPRTEQRFGGSGSSVGDDLSFKLDNISQDAYDIYVSGLPEGFYLKAARIGDEDVTESGADFTQGVPGGEMTVTINPKGAQIEGNVQNAKGENAAGATVTLIPDEKHRSIAWLYKTASTDQNGHFAIKGVRPGEYKIYAWEEVEYGAYQDPDFVKPHESAGVDISAKPNGHDTIQLAVIPAEDTAGQKSQP